MAAHYYCIGTPGKPWGDEEQAAWLKRASVVQRSYQEDVLQKLEALREEFDVEQYGALSQDPERYPLFVAKTRNWDTSKPSVLVTGGTHGYEHSGVHGALLFLQNVASRYSSRFNIAVCPCVSPWGYECIQRWNAKGIDPNRHYLPDSPCEECAHVMGLLAKMGVEQWTMHLDLHETTDSDATEFIPAKASREGIADWSGPEGIPDGFYLIGDSADPQTAWAKAVIEAVKQVVHIAPADEAGNLMGMPISQEGVVNSSRVGKGKGATNATFVATTEVYPDSKTKPMSVAQLNLAQVASITGGLDWIVSNVLDK